MHASSNFVVLLQGKKKDRKIATNILQQYLDDAEIEDDKKIVFEETYELVWIENIIDTFAQIAAKAQDLNFAVSGYVDCSENSGEFMDFGLICKDGILTSYTSDWEGYDDVEFDEDGDADECYGRYDRFIEFEEIDTDDIDAAFDEMCQNIQGQEWVDVSEVEI